MPTKEQAEHQAWINNPQSGYGDLNKYVTSQTDRYGQAQASGDQDLINRLHADAERVGYALPSQGGGASAGGGVMPGQEVPMQPGATGATFPASTLGGLEEFLKTFTDGHVQTQTAIAESNLNATLAELEASLEQAVAEGKISVRDAERQFEEQSKVIRQEAYKDAERTQLYGHDMGLQNSQQMVGLMQGDAARKNTMINENMTTRDLRVNDITDRLNAIKNQKRISADRAQADFRTDVMRAEGEGQQMFGQNMFDLQRDEHAAQRDHALGKERDVHQHELTLQQIDKTHGLNLERDVHQSSLRLNEMFKQHGFNLEVIDKEFDNLIEQMAKQHGYSMSQIGAQTAGQIKVAKEQAQSRMDLLNRERQMQMDDLRAAVTPGSPQYNHRIAMDKEERDRLEYEIDLKTQGKLDVINERMAIDIYQHAFMEMAQKHPLDSIPKNVQPHNFKPDTDGIVGNAWGNFMNWASNYDMKLDSYNTEQQERDAVKRMIERGARETPGMDLNKFTTAEKEGLWDAIWRWGKQGTIWQ